MKRTYHFLPKSAKSQGSSWSWRLRTRADERLEELLCDLGLRVTASDCEGCFWAEWIWVEWLEFQRSSATQMMLLAFEPSDTDSWAKTKTITNKTRCFCMSFFSSFFVWNHQPKVPTCHMFSLLPVGGVILLRIFLQDLVHDAPPRLLDQLVRPMSS